MNATLQSEDLSRTEKDHALERVLRSKTFARSEQLKSFLRFICEAERDRPGTTVNEYVIGVEVLGRPPGYSPAEDSSVRTRAYELRHKLESFYKTEAPDEPVQIVVPKGSYAPLYSRLSATVPVPATTPIAEQRIQVISAASITAARAAATKKLVKPIIWAGLLLLIGFALGWKAEIHSVPPLNSLDRTSALAEAWGPLLHHDASAVLCAATPLSLVVGPAEHEVYHSRSYPVPPETYTLFREHRLTPPDQQLGLTFSDNMIGVGTLNAALACSRILRQFGTAFQVLPERAATASALRGRNTLLFGAPIDSEAISRILQEMPLTVEFDPGVRDFVVKDHDESKRGLKLSPQKDRSGQFTNGFGLITVLHSHDADREPTETVLFSGITSIGIQAATEFFCSRSSMEQLRRKLFQEGCKGFPASYQVVVRCSFSNQLLLGFAYQDHRVIDKELPASS